MPAISIDQSNTLVGAGHARDLLNVHRQAWVERVSCITVTIIAKLNPSHPQLSCNKRISNAPNYRLL